MTKIRTVYYDWSAGEFIICYYEVDDTKFIDLTKLFSSENISEMYDNFRLLMTTMVKYGSARPILKTDIPDEEFPPFTWILSPTPRTVKDFNEMKAGGFDYTD